MESKLFELTSPQKSIWLTEQFYKGTAINNLCGTVHIDEKIDFNILEKALNSLIKNNSNFLINFKLQNGNLMQYLTDYKYFNIEIVDVQKVSDVQALEEKLKFKVFEIENNYLFDFKIFRFPNSTGGFVFSCHHLLGDSWSLGLVAKESIKAYNLIASGLNEDFSSSNYFDYCISEKKYLNSDKFNKDKEYWNTVFSTIPELASIPSKNKNSNTEISCKAARNTYVLPKNIMEQINAFCKTYKISVFNFIMCVYSLYISRVSNLKDFVIGTPILNRSNFSEKNTMGMFVSTAPLRVNLENKNTFLDLASNIAQNSMSMLRHQKYPYDYILEDLRKGNPNFPNLYNVLISYQITKTTNDALKHTTSWSFNGTCADEMQIHILDLNDTGTLNIAYDYKIQKYTSSEIEAMHKRIIHIINQIMQDNSILLKTIEIVTPDEKNELLYNFNNTDFDYDSKKTIAELFEEQVQKTPSKTALVFEGNALTYKELNEKANQLANYLINTNLKQGDIVGVLVNRSLEMIIGMIAIIKSGCTYLPIDPEYPSDRISYMLENSNCLAILVHNNTSNLISDDFTKINIDLDSKIYKSKYTKNLEIKFSSDNLLYLIYTSGSTGKPKGVMLTHKNIHNFINGIKNKIDFSSNKTIVSLTTICFDIFVLESWCSLCSGLKVVLANEKEQVNQELFNKLCLENNVNIIQTTPSRYSAFLENDEFNKYLKNVTDILIGGEPLPDRLFKKLKKYSSANIYNMYGPTETAVWSTICDLTKLDEITIGYPMVNTKCYILDENQNLLPKFTPGNLYIGGDGVSNGYLKRDDLNYEKFIDFALTHKKIYNTNDLAYQKEDGEIVHLGRTDYQVKFRGYRIELGEIENVISSFDGITSSAVIYNETLKKLYAFYTSNKNISIQDLKNYIINNLPIYMMPSKFIKLDEMPHTPNGKLDRNSLKYFKFSEDNEKHLPPTTDIEKKLYEIISSIISNKEFGITDDFFSIGMDSLNIIKLSSIIQKEFGINLSSSKIYKMFNIKEVASYLETCKSRKIEAIEKSAKQDFYPLSCAQKRIYYASKMSSNPLVYNICGGLVVDLKLDKNKVNNIFNELIKKHSSFRTCFKIIDNEPKQVVLDELKLDIKSHIHKNKNTNVNDLINKFPKPFDFENAPLLRVELHYIDDIKTLLLIDSHHIILDGSSLNILINEFCKLYNNEIVEDEKIDYKDFTMWENDFIKTNKFKELEENWLDTFKGVDIPAINLPYDFPFTQTKTYNGNTISLEIPQSLFKGLEVVAKNYKVSNYVLFLSAFYVLLYRYTSQDTIIVGSPISGRFDTSLENTLGMFVNNIALIANINSNSTFDKFVNNLKETVLTAIDNGIYPYDMLVKSLNLNTTSSVFDVMFTYQSENDELPKIEDKKIDIIYANTKTSKFNLSLEIIPTTNTLNLEYNTDLFKEDTINGFIKHYLNILENILNNPKAKLDSLEILSSEEKNKILYEFNNTYLDYPKDKTVAKMFEEQVQKNPEKTALVFGDEVLSFKALNEKANELANYLKDHNIGRGDIIGIMVPRSLELVVSILASLKCGSCYIPIDPHFPIDRISYMLENSHSKVLITTKDTYSKTQYEQKIDISFDNLNIYNGNKNNLDIPINPEDNSYIIYTSGSTGKPKGVVLKHSSLTNLAYHLNNNLEFFKNPSLATMCSVTTASFDIFLFESILCLSSGVKVVIANEDEQKIPTKLNNLITKNNINAIQMTPSRMQFFLDNIADFPALRNLKYVILAGEPLPEKLLKDILRLGVKRRISRISRRWKSLRNSNNSHNYLVRSFSPTGRKFLQSKKVYNGYGPSETTVFSTFTDVTNQDVVTIGRPLANTQMYILDKDLNPCPIGVLGELYIAGDGVGGGYLNNIELTHKSYIPNPFIKNSIMYKVGDLCKFDLRR